VEERSFMPNLSSCRINSCQGGGDMDAHRIFLHTDRDNTFRVIVAAEGQGQEASRLQVFSVKSSAVVNYIHSSPMLYPKTALSNFHIRV